ncbi:MAG: response regulator transcription factor [Saprospiraceae bacterium]|nr:response regulator transcription factor [Saprospiraceae bacterium]
MNCLIIEDEFHAAKRLSGLVTRLRPNAQILKVLDSVDDATEWLEQNTAPDLIFMDIQLADGLSFEIFKKTRIEAPVIFTTAFDEYALRAFKTNSVDYLLKPVDEPELAAALEKFERLFGKTETPSLTMDAIQSLLKAMAQPEYSNRFIIKTNQGLTYISVQEIAWFLSDGGLTYLVSHNNKRHHLDYTLEQLEDLLDPKQFFRINRKMIVGIQSVQKVSDYFNSRLKIALRPASGDEDSVVSRERVKAFKGWLGA